MSEGVANVRRVSVTDRPAPPAPRAETAGAPGFVQDALLGADGSVDGGDPHELPLHRTTFVVVDLETTGGSPDGGGITEIGAVKVRGGVELGSLGTLVNPGQPIPPFITVLTGITQAMIAPAPPIETVLPTFLEFLSDAVLVAHNAPYDVGFLKAACARHGYRWPNPRVLDTVALARRVLTRDEVPNRKLGTLAAYFRTTTQPNHRALDDARATVEVLHALIGRLGGHDVHTLGGAIEFARAVTPTQRRKRHLADGLPKGPGVYIFRAADDRPLYVGTSTDIATRVRSYFTASEKRARMSEMLAAAERVDAVECAHGLEAEVRELRLIAGHDPPYNRRSKYPERALWLKLTAEPYPRLSIVRAIGPDDVRLSGAVRSRRTRRTRRGRLPRGGAAAPVHAPALGAHHHRGLRPGGARALPGAVRAPRRRRGVRPAGRRAVPGRHGRQPAAGGRGAAGPDRDALGGSALRGGGGDPQPAGGAAAGDDPDAAADRVEPGRRDRRRPPGPRRRLGAGAGAARPPRRRRRLPAGRHPRATLEVIRATAETVLSGGHGPVPHATAEESERILSWLERPETRLVQISEGWASPADGAERYRDLLTKADSAGSAGRNEAGRG